MQFEEARRVRGAEGTSEEDVEGGQVRGEVVGGGAGGREEVVGWEAGGVEGGVVRSETAEGPGVLGELLMWVVCRGD